MVERPRVVERWRTLPWWAQVSVVYVAARGVSVLFFVLAAALATEGSRFGAGATLTDFAVGWDAQWYWFAAVNGYPTELPLTESGAVAENQWAFMPVYAWFSTVLGGLLGSWGAGAVMISLVSGLGASLVLYRLWCEKISAPAAMWAVVLFANAPLSALFHVGYAEALFLFLLFLALLLVVRRRYGWLYVIVPVMGFTRPGVLAFSLFLALWGIYRWWHRRTDPLPLREIVHIVAVGLIAAAVGFAWQFVAAFVTGDVNAYLATELAWRRNWINDAGAAFVPFEGFVDGAQFWFTAWGNPAWVGTVALALMVVALAAVLTVEPHVKRLGVEVRLWSASYLLYLLAVFFPQSSIFRLLVPLSPLWGALAIPPSRIWRVTVLIGALFGQWWWIYNMYAWGNTYWQIP